MDEAKPDPTTVDTATVFEDEKGQAVRLPDEYRLKTSAVRIRREGKALLIEPMENEETKRQRERDKIFANLGEPFDDDMVEAALNRPGPDEYDRLDCDLRLKD